MPNLDKMSPRNSQHMCNVCGTDKRLRASEAHAGYCAGDERGSETNFETSPSPSRAGSMCNSSDNVNKIDGNCGRNPGAGVKAVFYEIRSASQPD